MSTRLVRHKYSNICVCSLDVNQSGDKFVVKTRVSQSAARLFFKNFIYKLPNKEVPIFFLPQ